MQKAVVLLILLAVVLLVPIVWLTTLKTGSVTARQPQFAQPVPFAGVGAGPTTDATLRASANQILRFQDAQVSLVDTRTNAVKPLMAFSRRFADDRPGGGPTTTVSPDGRWLLWMGGDARQSGLVWKAATLDGRRLREWPITVGSGRQIAWMRDSRHWIEFISPDCTGSNLDALLFSVDTPGVKKTAITLPSLCSPTGLWVTPANHVVVASMIDGAGSDDLFDFGPTPGTAPPLRTTCNVPGHVRGCVPSPDGRRLAWLLYTVHDAPRRDVPERVVTFLTQTQSLYTVNIWVSNADGSGFHPISPERDITAGHSASGIQWTPDGKDVTYLADHSVWAIPAD